jgi:hypothetical protein
MKRLLNFAKFSLIIVLTCNCLILVAQECEIENVTNTSLIAESKNGWILPASGTIRILLVFIEINYDVGNDPVPGTTTGWPKGHLPTWKDDVVDPFPPSGTPSGKLTRYFSEASYGSYIVLGDYLTLPNNETFKVNYSDIISNGYVLASINAINNSMSTISTGSLLNSITHFDLWSKTAPGEAKITPSIDNPPKWDHVMFIYRNSSSYNSGLGAAFPNGTTTST